MDSIDRHDGGWAGAVPGPASRAGALLAALCLLGAPFALACRTATPPTVAAIPPDVAAAPPDVAAAPPDVAAADVAAAPADVAAAPPTERAAPLLEASTPAGPGAPSRALVPVDTGGRGLLFVRSDHGIGRYDDLLIEHIGFRYAPRQRGLSFREEDRISALLKAAVEGNQDGAIGLANEAGPCVLAVRFLVTDLELYESDLDDGSGISFVRSFGEATMVMELRDSVTGEVLASFAQRRALGGGPHHGGTGASIRRLGETVGLAMRDMGEELRKRTPPSAGGRDDECHGGLTRVALGAH